ncbi:nitroreductase/quinone reductase family protein [Pseudonocardia thermophila]|uniref:nitroreductase/quinone reductase family protein n=1 Tax=Pseudonocardia thermophila TaxID=1848 RepID=UPI00190E9F11|nr:nitroreductase/quinone reductase family protein [Pseudonocardia thermophila]
MTGHLPAWLPTANRVVRGLARLGVPLGTVHVLTVPGRRTGEPRPTPVSPLTVDGRRYVVAALPHADWARNARAAGHGSITARRTTTPVRITEVDDPELKRSVLRAFPTEVPHGVAFFQRLGLVERADPGQFAAIADQVAVFELSTR